MKIGIFTDVHNNVYALNEVLKHFEAEDCEELICCGDLNGIGPWPKDTVARAAALNNLHCVLGNHELLFINGLDPIPEGMGEAEVLQHEWEFGLFTKEEQDYIRRLPKTLLLEREGVRIAVQHYSLNSEGRYANYTPSPSFADCEKMFAGIQADVICCGHDHSGFIAEESGKLYINSGSLGCPGTLGGIARAGILTVEGGDFSYKPLEAPYDLSRVVEQIDLIKYPDYEIVKKIFFGI